MRLEGTLDAFSLPDIFQLLSSTKKTGALHLRRAASEGGPQRHGVVHVRDGEVTGARGDAARQELARRLVGTGLVDDEALAQAVEQLAHDPGTGLARLLVERADLEPDAVVRVAAEQIADAVFDLLRWPDGEFAFLVDEVDVDDLDARLPVEPLVAEGRRRLETFSAVVEQVPAAHSVLRLAPAAPPELAVAPQEWALLALVDGRRTVADLVGLSGQGEYAVVTALAALVGRGLLITEPGDDRLLRRHQLLSALEGVVVPPERVSVPPENVSVPPEHVASVPAVVPAPTQHCDPTGLPARLEPLTPSRHPDHPEPVPAAVRAQLDDGRTRPTAGHGSVHGATALQPEAVPATSGLIERDPDVHQRLLLRLIAGVKGL